MMKRAFVAPNSIWKELDLRNINQQEQIRQYGTNTNDLKKTLKGVEEKKHKKVGGPLKNPILLALIKLCDKEARRTNDYQ